MQKLFNTQLYRPKDFKGLIADNHFYELYQQRPQLLDKAIQQIYQTNLQGSMVNFVNRFPEMEVELENGFYQWMLKGQEDKNVPLVDITDEGGTTLTGAQGSNRQRIRLVFSEPMFERTNVLKVLSLTLLLHSKCRTVCLCAECSTKYLVQVLRKDRTNH